MSDAMTDEEGCWLTSNDPIAAVRARYPLQSLSSAEPQGRKSRMYLVACARCVWDRLPGACRALVELAELIATDPRGHRGLRGRCQPIAERLMNSDGEREDLIDAVRQLETVVPAARGEQVLGYLREPIPEVEVPGDWRELAALVYLPFDIHTQNFAWARPLHDVHLLREVFGNPFRYVLFDPNWRSDTAVSLARTMYDSREFSAMPILADALQDAGCDSDEMLNHCRHADPSSHVRGCWVVDRVLDLR
jgi:hypothetical protein